MTVMRSVQLPGRRQSRVIRRVLSLIAAKLLDDVFEGRPYLASHEYQDLEPCGYARKDIGNF